MDEQWIEKKKEQVDVTLFDGSEHRGQIFLLSETPSDILNAERSWIPLKTAKGVLLLNTSQIVSVKMSEAWEEDDLVTLGNQYSIVVHMVQGIEIPCKVFVNLREESSRVKDYFNQPFDFLPMFQEGRVVYVHQKFILYVEDEVS